MQGGRVIVERRYSNAPPDRLREFTSLDRFREYLNAFLTHDQTEKPEHHEKDILTQFRNDEPDNSIYTDPETFGSNRGTELDKAFRSGKQTEKS
jgi:hypothetical protein